MRQCLLNVESQCADHCVARTQNGDCWVLKLVKAAYEFLISKPGGFPKSAPPPEVR